jgi:hypothetical protein
MTTKEIQNTQDIKDLNIKDLNIYQRLSKVISLEAIKNCPKNGELKIGGALQYKYFKADDVVNRASLGFTQFGIVFSVMVEKIDGTTYRKITIKGEKDMHYVTIQGKAILTNIDKPDDKIETSFFGSAEDEGDKAFGKANTYAKKIALMNILMIQDGEDTDATPSQEGIIKRPLEEFEELKKKIIGCQSAEYLAILADNINSLKKKRILNDEQVKDLREAYSTTRKTLK